MKTKIIIQFFFLSLIIALSSCSTAISELNSWLALNSTDRPALSSTDFAQKVLSKGQADKAEQLLFLDKQKQILEEYAIQWDDRCLEYERYKMPFYYEIFGDRPADGRSLFISLHGGGGTPSEVNDQQYENQKHLYHATMDTLEGVYLAPRAPGNTWDLWHKDHIDEFLNIIIQLAVIKENVNPNKVYLLGYSAGGDGVYQLAPRMADRWAAASMMAGHPNDASALNLRNLPFAIYAGALDTAYDRNIIAGQWGDTLDSLQKQDPKGYIHDVHILPGLGHWMYLQDAAVLVWMKKYERNPIPDKIIWKQDNVHYSGFYWLQVPEKSIHSGDKISARYEPTQNEINIIENNCDTLHILMNDSMLDLDKKIRINYQGKLIFEGVVKRSILNIYNSLEYKGDANSVFTACLHIIQNKFVLR